MTRMRLIQIIGEKYWSGQEDKPASNAIVENTDFSYKKAFAEEGLEFPSDVRHYKCDLRFEDSARRISIIVETKKSLPRDVESKAFKEAESQLREYTKLEHSLRRENAVLSVLYDLGLEKAYLYRSPNFSPLPEDTQIHPLDDYYDRIIAPRVNNREKVIETTLELNTKLNKLGIAEDMRSQFVGSLLVALNSGRFNYDANLKTEEYINRVKMVLQEKIENEDGQPDKQRQIKTKILIDTLDNQKINNLTPNDFKWLLDKVNNGIVKYIDSKSAFGEDLLNLFFTTFNKYAHKRDKNQAFTPAHITDFMCEIVGLDMDSKVLDPTCGSGSFLVQAMAKMLAKSWRATEPSKKRLSIKQSQLFGIEIEQNAFGLATTNMMIHEDGKTNILKASCFAESSCEWIRSKDIDTILMNPPFNANERQELPPGCPRGEDGMDRTSGLYFVHHVAGLVKKNAMLATILPYACARSQEDEVLRYKEKMLREHTLLAVFSLPNNLFHPGANVNACIMLFRVKKPHSTNDVTFFGYCKDDGFVVKKNKGRVEQMHFGNVAGLWDEKKELWLDAFFNRREIKGLSVCRKITARDEWLAEAYMETDYASLTELDFIKSIRDFVAFKVRNYSDVSEK